MKTDIIGPLGRGLKTMQPLVFAQSSIPFVKVACLEDTNEMPFSDLCAGRQTKVLTKHALASVALCARALPWNTDQLSLCSDVKPHGLHIVFVHGEKKCVHQLRTGPRKCGTVQSWRDFQILSSPVPQT